MSLQNIPRTRKHKRLFVYLGALVFTIVLSLGLFAKNRWLPSSDMLTGKRTSSWNPFAAPLPTPTPQLSKELIYAGTRLLSVVDANAQEAPPADLAVWRPSTSGWWVLGGQGSQQITQNWGTVYDEPVEGDYDGDGKTDFAVWRKTESSPGAGDVGNWYIINSSSSTTAQYPFGTSGDIPAPADYDGDGKTDHALFRPSNANWYIDPSSSATNLQSAFGLSTDKIAPADYDGDGRSDIAVWRDSDKTFYSLNSSNGALQTPVMPEYANHVVSSDYDGDGKADYAIRYGATWIIRKSSDLTTYSWAPPGDLGTDIPVQNDYDGDGKTDIATWRNSNGNWYIRQSASGNSLRQVQWGIPGDIPVPAFYRR